MVEYLPIVGSIRDSMISLFCDRWGGFIVVSRGKAHDVRELDGFAAVEKGNLVGAVTFCITGEECEVVSLDSLRENVGIGTALLNLVICNSRKCNCRRIWLITTNDNTAAIRFYQKRNFQLCAFHPNAVDQARRIKPGIPRTGMDGIPIHHEIELEIVLREG